MSSVTSSDRAKQTQETRDAREEYQTRESENAKKRAKEIKREREKNAEAIARLTENFDNEIQELRNKNREVMTEKDEANQRKIDQVRNLYTDQFKRKTEQSESDRKQMRSAYEDRIEKDKMITDQQKTGLRRAFTESMRAKDRDLEEMSNKSTEGLKNQVQVQADKLRTKHENDVANLRKSRDQEVLDYESRLADQKSRNRSDVDEMKRYHRQQREAAETSWEQRHKADQKNTDENLSVRDQGLKAEKEELREKYRQAIDEKSKEYEEAFKTLREDVSGRMNTQLRSARNEVAELKHARGADISNDRRMRDLDRKSAEKQYEARYNDLYKQRDEIYNVVNQRARDKIDQSTRSSEKMLSDINVSNQSRLHMMQQKMKDDREQLELTHDAEVATVTNNSEKRSRSLMKETTENEKVKNRYYRENIEQMRGSFNQKLQEQRETHQDQVSSIAHRMEKKYRDNSLNWSRKLEATIDGYETKIDELKQSYEAELKRLNQIAEQRMKDREKGHHTESESREMQIQVRLAGQEEQHRKEVERMEKRHQEQMQSLASRMAVVLKKA